MTQDEHWLKKYQEVVDFIETNKRNPSKYNQEEIKELLELGEKYKHKNQYQYQYQ